MLKLKEIKKDRLVIFDLDDTLVKTDAKIKIVHRRSKKIIMELTPQEFNNLENVSSHMLDFDDFDCPEILRQGRIIHSVFSKLKSYYKKGIPVSIVTARSSSKLVRDFFLENGIDIHPSLIIAVNDPVLNLKGSIPEKKQEAIKGLIDSGYTKLVFFDDSQDNLILAKDLEGYKQSRVRIVKVD